MITLEELDAFYEYIENRMEGQLELKMVERSKRMYSAIYGYITMKPEELTIMDSMVIQRLRNISHLGLAYLVYPECNHTRFDHSIGVFHLTKEVIKSFEEKGVIDPEIKKNAPMAALLHDCGHYPFSHVVERAFSLNHKLRGTNIIMGEDDIFNLLWNKYKNEEFYKIIYEFLNEQGYAPELISHWIAPYNRKIDDGTLKKYEDFSLIHGVLDVDKMDYLTRDSFFSGIPFGAADINRIIRALTIIVKNNKKYLGVEEKALDAIIHYVMGNEMDYNAIACHHTVRIAESMLLTALRVVIDKLDIKNLKKFVTYLGVMNDNDLLFSLDIISNILNNEYINEILKRIRFRKLFKSIIIKSTDELVAEKMHTLKEAIKPVHEKPYAVPARMILYLTKNDFDNDEINITKSEWNFEDNIVIFDLKDMPADKISYMKYATEKISGKEETRPLYVLENGQFKLLNNYSILNINPQDILNRYIQFSASILCIGTENDRDKEKLLYLKTDNYNTLCSYLKNASIKKFYIDEKIKTTLISKIQ